ncbi:MAG: thioesterase family protein [Afipia sp.]|jgi:predicted thioesterase|nr:thioesterase family protein [Afipia sp.]MBS4004624.1 thioesterase family protein [Afipia sp.]WIG49258.1 MAG: thioesterase family protein [Afipia sp.]
MSTLEKVTVGIPGERIVTVTHDMTVQHFLATMPPVYATPVMILHMEEACTASIARLLPEGHVSVGMEVNVRHLAATPIGRTVRVTSRVRQIDPKSVLFDVEAWDGDRKIGDGTHRRGAINVAAFEKRFGVV